MEECKKGGRDGGNTDIMAQVQEESETGPLGEWEREKKREREGERENKRERERERANG